MHFGHIDEISTEDIVSTAYTIPVQLLWTLLFQNWQTAMIAYAPILSIVSSLQWLSFVLKRSFLGTFKQHHIKYVDTSCNLNLICQHAKNFQMYWSIYLARILSSQNSRCHQTDSDRAVVIRLSQVAMSEWSSTQNSNVI